MMALTKMGVIAVTGVLLSGCSLFGGHETAAVNASQPTEIATTEVLAEIDLEVGRANLANGNLATAARYLLQARNHTSTRADATNALGVVYARLGRLDVAQRYFQEALEMDPENARFATNLARLEGDISFARLRALDNDIESATEMAALDLPVQTTAATPIAETPAARRSPHVIHIRTADTSNHAPPRMEVFARRPVVQAVRSEETQGEIPERTEREISHVKVVDYPIRIEI